MGREIRVARPSLLTVSCGKTSQGHDLLHGHEPGRTIVLIFLEAQQRYFSYCAMLVAIVSQNSFVLVLMGYRTIIERYVAKWGIAQMFPCETQYERGGIAPFCPKHQNHLFWELSLFWKFRLKSPNLVDFWSWKCLFYWVRRKRFRLILQTRDF